MTGHEHLRASDGDQYRCAGRRGTRVLLPGDVLDPEEAAKVRGARERTDSVEGDETRERKTAYCRNKKQVTTLFKDGRYHCEIHVVLLSDEARASPQKPHITIDSKVKKISFTILLSMSFWIPHHHRENNHSSVLYNCSFSFFFHRGQSVVSQSSRKSSELIINKGTKQLVYIYI